MALERWVCQHCMHRFTRSLKQCELCGGFKKLTNHHVMPQEISKLFPCQHVPARHARVGLCEECHIKLHRQYTNEQLAYMGWDMFPNTQSQHPSKIKWDKHKHQFRQMLANLQRCKTP